MTPKWLFNFNRWLMVISLIAFLAVSLVELVMIPFLKRCSYEFVCFLCDFNGWFYPISLALIIVSSGVYVQGFCEYMTVRKKKNESESK